MISEEIYESCSRFKHRDDEERAEALEDYLRPKCSTPRILEENVLGILWRWKLEEDDIQASPPRRGRTAPLSDMPMRLNTGGSSTPHIGFRRSSRYMEGIRSSWEAPSVQRGSASTSMFAVRTTKYVRKLQKSILHSLIFEQTYVGIFLMRINSIAIRSPRLYRVVPANGTNNIRMFTDLLRLPRYMLHRRGLLRVLRTTTVFKMPQDRCILTAMYWIHYLRPTESQDIERCCLLTLAAPG